MKPLHFIALITWFYCTQMCYAQVRVMPGTSFVVDSATNVNFSKVSGQFTIDSGATVINNGVINLGRQVSMRESTGYPVKGNGFEQADTSFAGTFAHYPSGGMGLLLSSSNSGNLVVKRYHQALNDPLSGENSVKRYFEITSANYPLTFTAVRFAVDTTELNGHSRHTLALSGQENLSAPFQSVGGTFVNDTLDISHSFDSLTVLTLMPQGLWLDSIVAAGFCPGDDILFYYHSSGIHNAGAWYSLELSGTPAFTSTVFTDSSQLVSGVFTYTIPADQAVNETLYARIVNTSNGFMSQPYDSVNIRTAPAVAVSADTLFCFNDGQDIATGIPAGGIFSGSMVDAAGIIYPGMAGAGTFNMYYQFTDAFGCSNTDTLALTVLPLPVTPTVSNAGNVLTCNEAGYTYQWYYNGSIIPSETGITHTAAQDGQYQVSITDANGCSNISDSFNLIFTHLQSIPGAQQAHIYPNPAQDYVMIAAANEIERVVVYDAAGKQTAFFPAPAKSVRIATGEFARGLYIFTVYTASYTQSLRVEIIR